MPEVPNVGYINIQVLWQKEKMTNSLRKKPDIGIELIDRSLSRGLSPGIVFIDGGYGNNTTFLKKLEERELKYLGKIAKNRQVRVKLKSLNEIEIRIDRRISQKLAITEF